MESCTAAMDGLLTHLPPRHKPDAYSGVADARRFGKNVVDSSDLSTGVVRSTLAKGGRTMTVEAILRSKGRDVVTISSDATLEQVAKRLIEHRIGALVVTSPSTSERIV